MKMYSEHKIKYIIIISIICILDQFSKFYIDLNLPKYINKDIIIFTIEFVRNDGAAFNILSGNRILLSFISIVSSILLFYYIFIVESKTINKYGLAFILGGSISNGIDRIMIGYVIDFLKIKFINFPVFNIADIAINIGVLILMISYFKNKSK